MLRNTSTSNKKGFSLIELCIALGIVAILAGTIVPVFIKRIQIKAGEKTAAEMSVIQQAALSYFVANNAWPASIQALQNAGYLNPSWVTNNPWQNAYTISSNSGAFTVSTTVPQEWTNLVARDLPTSSISGVSVGSTVPVPGSAQNDSLPIGAIVMWSGTVASIPSGWALCDGTNGTPDLRDRFVVGARQDSGGKAQTNITGALTQSGGNVYHTHAYSGKTDNDSGGNNTKGGSDTNRAYEPHTHTYSGTTSNSTTVAVPYYALCFIMKIQ